MTTPSFHGDGKVKVWLVQQGVWEMPLESVPLVSGYLKAMIEADEGLKRALDVRIFNFKGGATQTTMAQSLFFEEAPDILAFSVLGWNQRAFLSLASTFRMVNPNGWTIMGGPQ